MLATKRCERRRDLDLGPVALDRLTTPAATWRACSCPGSAARACPESANIPASRIDPGITTETRRRSPARSSRSASANPRQPELGRRVERAARHRDLALDRRDEDEVPDSPRASTPSSAWVMRIGASRFTRSARSISSVGAGRACPRPAARVGDSTSISPASRGRRSPPSSARSATATRCPSPGSDAASSSSSSGPTGGLRIRGAAAGQRLGDRAPEAAGGPGQQRRLAGSSIGRNLADSAAAMKLYICWGTFQTLRPGGHPCRNAYRGA